MELEFRTSRSTVSPPLLDTTSSEYVTYVRKNVREIHEQDPVTNQNTTSYEYDEAILSKQDYALYVLHTKLAGADAETQAALAEVTEIATTAKSDMELALAELTQTLLAPKE